MNGQALMKGLGHIDEKFIEEAERPMDLSSRSVLRRCALAAACLCILILGIWAAQPNSANDGPYDTTPDTVAGQKDTVLQEENICNADQSLVFEDTPSVVMRVEEWTDSGFVGTVVRQGDTELFPLGLELTVLYSDNLNMEQASSNDNKRGQYDDTDQFRLYQVRVVSYDEANATITILPILKAVD